MKITFKNFSAKTYNEADSAILKPYLLAHMKHTYLSNNEYILPNHLEDDVDKIIDDLYYDKEGCVGCGEDRYGGAAGYCAPCWNDVYGCEE
jgi:hypothetical protein